MLSNTESILGASTADTIVLLTALTGGTIDLAGGLDTLSCRARAPNSINVANTESILGAGAADTAVLPDRADRRHGRSRGRRRHAEPCRVPAPTASISRNTESIQGAAAADTVVLTTALTVAPSISPAAATH